MKLYVGKLPFSATDSEVRTLFAQYGDVSSVELSRDLETGRFLGFGFVEMPDDHEAQTAIENLDGYMFGGEGRTIEVRKARPHGSPHRGEGR